MTSERIGRLLLLGCVASGVLLSGCGRFNARRELKKGNAEYRRNEYEEARKHYEEVTRLVSTESLDAVRATLYTGYAYWKQYRFGSKHPDNLELAQQAIGQFNRYIELRPPEEAEGKDFPAVKAIDERIITLMIDAEWFELAVDRMKAKLEEDPDDPAILRGIATAYDKWGQPTMAARYYDKWAEKFPETESPHVAIAAYTWNMSYRRASTMTPLDRNRWIDNGLAACDRALTINDEHFEGLLYRNLLLRERAKMRLDPDKIASLQTEADQILAHAKVIRAKKKAEEAAAKAAAEAAAAAAAPEGDA